MLRSTGTCVAAVWVAPYDRLRLTEAIMHLALNRTAGADYPATAAAASADGWDAAPLVHRLPE
jgi:hypothetical protein